MEGGPKSARGDRWEERGRKKQMKEDKRAFNTVWRQLDFILKNGYHNFGFNMCYQNLHWRANM